MFGKDQQQSAFDMNAHAERQKFHWGESLKALGNIGSTLEQFLKAYLGNIRNEASELLLFSTTEKKTYQSNGYRFNRVYVGDSTITDAAKVQITVDGITWTVTLAAGENVLNLPEGAQFTATTTSGNGFMAYLVRSNHE